MTTTYHLQVGDAKGAYDGRATLRAALSDAASAARFEDEPVTIFRAEGDDESPVLTAIYVISALPVPA